MAAVSAVSLFRTKPIRSCSSAHNNREFAHSIRMWSAGRISRVFYGTCISLYGGQVKIVEGMLRPRSKARATADKDMTDSEPQISTREA
jgi:hypothetical protein